MALVLLSQGGRDSFPAQGGPNVKSAVAAALHLVAIFCTTAAVAAPLMGRDQALKELRAAKVQNGINLALVEAKMTVLVGPASPEEAMRSNINEIEIESLSNQRQEFIWRQELIDRLVLQIDSRFKGGDLRDFLSERLVEMAKADLLETAGNKSLWKQMTYLSQTLRQIPERGENIIGFIDGYLKNSSFKKPLRPDEYLRTRAYSNGGEHVAATPATKDQVGEMVEQRLMEIEAAAPVETLQPAQN